MTAGWIVALVTLAAFSAFGYAAYRKRWPSSPKLRLATFNGAPVDSGSVPEKETAKKDNKDSHSKKDDHQSSDHPGSSVKDKIVTAVIWVVSVLVVMYLLVAAVHWLFGAGTFTNTRTGGIVRTAPPIAGSSSAKTVDPAPASDDCSVTLVDGVMPDWIKVPKGYAADINAEGQANIGMQCSFTDDSPPKDADGPNYWCSGPKPIAPWFRPYIYQHAAATVTFHCHLRRIDL